MTVRELIAALADTEERLGQLRSDDSAWAATVAAQSRIIGELHTRRLRRRSA